MDLYRPANEAEVQLIWLKRRQKSRFNAQEDEIELKTDRDKKLSRAGAHLNEKQLHSNFRP